jgi:phage terminase large subunit
VIIKGLDKWVLPVFQPYLRDYHTRINVYYGGAGSGKSHFVVQKLILKALQMERKCLVVRKTGKTLRDSVWTLFLRILGELNGVVKVVNKSDFTITLINGSVFLFKGLDDPEKIKSIDNISDIFIEEATELTPTDFDQLSLRLRSSKPYNQIHLAFNPVSKANWCYKYFFESGEPDNCVVVRTTYKDNPHLPQEYIDSLLDMQNRNPAYYKIYALGDFATLDKLVFPMYEKRLISQEEVQGLEFWCGMDFGLNSIAQIKQCELMQKRCA